MVARRTVAAVGIAACLTLTGVACAAMAGPGPALTSARTVPGTATPSGVRTPASTQAPSPSPSPGTTLTAIGPGTGSTAATPATTPAGATTTSKHPAAAPTPTPTPTRTPARTPTAPGSATSSGSAAAPTPAATGDARTVLDRMSLAQRVGQLFMVGTPATGASAAVLSDISTYHVGSVILTGRSYAGVSATAAVTAELQSAAPPGATLGVPLIVAADQEGGAVQVLQGPGFSRIAPALVQGGWSASTLVDDAEAWGAQLRAAGVNLDLAPVLDVVPAGTAADNPPIGYYDREYGQTPAAVTAAGDAFAEGLRTAGVAVTVKHFPGLGRVTANTDTTSGVTDYVTTPDDPYLAPFRSAIGQGAGFVMMSTAYYHQIDPANPAAFSSTVIGTMLRRELGFTGVVVSDDLGAAAQVQAWSPAARALAFLSAGGDLILTVTPTVVPEMVAAVTQAAQSSPTFRARVDAAALLVLQAKQRMGLIR